MLEMLFTRGDGLDALRVVIAVASLAVSAIYLRFVDTPPSTARTAMKTAGIATLTLLPFTYLGVVGAYTSALVVLAVALALSALGDFLLALEDQSRFFVMGLASFLAAHIAYLMAFLPRANLPGAFALTLIAIALLAAATFLAILAPKLGKLRLPVFAYFAVIMAMVASALSIAEAPWYLGAGAVIFALSDSLIAQRKFLAPFPKINEAVWVTYIAAQFMLTAGLLALLIPAQVG